MNPLEHFQVLYMLFQIVVSLKVYRPLYMMGARLSWPVYVETNIIVNIFVNIRPIVNIVVSLDCY